MRRAVSLYNGEALLRLEIHHVPLTLIVWMDIIIYVHDVRLRNAMRSISFQEARAGGFYDRFARYFPPTD